MSVLNNDISKLGGCLISDFYNVEITALSEETYRAQFERAYGIDMCSMSPLEKFERCLWKQPKNIPALTELVENHIMPDGPHAEAMIADFIRQTAQSCFNWKYELATGRQINNGTITAGVTYTFKDNSLFVVQLLRIKLTRK